MRKILILFSIFLLFLGNLYQKVRITILAYQVYEKKVLFDNLVEERKNLVYNLRRDINLPKLATRLWEKDFKLSCVRRYVQLVPTKAPRRVYRRGESLFAKVLGFSSKVEAQP